MFRATPPKDSYRNFHFDPYAYYTIDVITTENNAYVLRINKDKIWTFVNYGQESSFAFSRNVRDSLMTWVYVPDEHFELSPEEILIFKTRIDDFQLKKKQESEKQAQILKAYTTADEIPLPANLDNIFIDSRQNDTSLENLAISYSTISPEYRQGLQLFEIPMSDDNCQAYCGNGYGNHTCGDEWWEPTADKGWVKLPNNTDFSCKKRYEKVFCYAYEKNGSIIHATRQWGDGTILSKMGQTRDGATPVYRVMDPLHPSIVESYGSVQSIWIRPYQNGVVPAPFFRDQSTYTGGSVYFCKSWQRVEQVKAKSILDWQILLEELKRRRSSIVPVIDNACLQGTSLEFKTETTATLTTLEEKTFVSTKETQRSFSLESAISPSSNTSRNDAYIDSQLSTAAEEMLPGQKSVVGGNNGALTTQPVTTASLREVVNAYKVNKPSYHKYSMKKEMLDNIMEKISSLYAKGGQDTKLNSLFKIYTSFIKMDLSNNASVTECLNLINDDLDKLNSFSSFIGKCGAFIKQSIFSTGYINTMSDTRILGGKLIDFIEKNAFPRERIRYEIKTYV